MDYNTKNNAPPLYANGGVAVADPIPVPYDNLSQLRPPVATAVPVSSFSVKQGGNTNGARSSLPSFDIEKLKRQGFTEGMAKSLGKNKESFPVRFWIIDNSGSMSIQDGHRIVETDNKVQFVNCSRWEEIVETVSFHAHVSGELNAPTYFRLLNNPYNGCPSNFEVATNEHQGRGNDVLNAQSILSRTQPSGVTPLMEHVITVQQEIGELASVLRNDGQRAVFVIATDGLPTDRNGNCSSLEKSQFINALRTLEGLPIWLVIRLCTDDDDVVDFYNNIDNELELSIDVLDDFEAEAKEVHEQNTWINYALPIHRMRELGFYDRTFDLIDERTLSKREVRDYCRVLFGEDAFDGCPDPSTNWDGFATFTSILVNKEKKYYDPIRKKQRPLIDIVNLNRTYNDSGNCCVLM